MAGDQRAGGDRGAQGAPALASQAAGDDPTALPSPGVEETLPASQPLEATLPVAGAPGGPVLPLPRGDRSRYAFADEVARGGMGRIVRAQDRALGRPVAIKELILRGDDARSRFVREALVTSRLQHPAIVPVYDAGTWPSGEPFYAMKLVAGRSLADVLRKTETTADRLALVPTLTTVAEAIAYAHSRGIIHRDLKPANILVGEFGETVVIDWGLAKEVGSEDSAATAATSAAPDATLAGTVMGTPAYMAPEQARGERVDERADVHALGAILYHVLAGSAPYVGKTVDAVLEAVIAGPAPDLERALRGVPADLAAIVRRAMARDAAERFPSARELAAELDRFQKGQLIASHRYTLAQRVARFLRKNRTAAGVAGVLLVALAATALLSVRRIVRERDRADALRVDAEHQRAEAVRFRKDAEERASALTLQQARTALAADPTAAVAWLLQIPETRPGWGAARIIATGARANGVAAARIHESAAVTHVEVMPDGHTLLMQGSDRFWLRDLAAGKELQIKVGRLDRLASNGLDPVAVLAGGKALVYARGRGLGVLRLDGRRVSQVSLDSASSDVMEILPGDTTFKIVDDNGVLATYDLTGSPPRLDRSFAGQVSHFAVASHGPGMALAGAGGVFLFDGHRQLSAPGEHYGRVAMSDDGQWVAAVSLDANAAARLWNVASGKLAAIFDGRAATDLAFSPDSAFLAVANGSHLFEVAVGSGELVRSRSDAARTVRYLPDGSLVYAGDDAVEMLARGAALRLGHDGATDFALLPDGRMVTVGSRGDLRLWDVQAQLRPGRVDPTSSMARLSLSRDGAWLMSSQSTDAQPIAEVRTPTALRAVVATLPEHLPRGLVVSASFSGPSGFTLHGAPFPLWTQFAWDVTRDGVTSVVASQAEGLVARTPAAKLTLMPAHHFTEVVLAGGGALTAGVFDDGELRLFELPSGRERRLPDATGLSQLALSGSGRWLAAVHRQKGNDQLVVYATDTGKRVIQETQNPHGAAKQALINQLALSPDGRRVAAAVDNGYVQIWLLEPPHLERSLDAGTTPMRLAFAADSSSLAVSGADGKVRIVALGVATEPRILRGPSAPLTALAVSADGAQLAAGSEDGKVWLWDLASGEGVELWRHPTAVVQLVFAPAGLLSVSKQGGIRQFAVDLPGDARALRHDLSAATTVRIDADDQAWTPP